MIGGDTAMAFGWAWLSATVVLAIHVGDEAAHDFLDWYNPSAVRIRRLLRVVPFPPTFTFWPWLLGLSAAVLLLGLLTPLAFAGALWLRPIAYAVAILHVINGLLHLVASAVIRRRAPGVLSAPLLLLAGVWLARAAARLV